MKNNVLTVWGSGQLLAFSGLDGETKFGKSLVLRTALSGVAIEIKIPENGGTLVLPEKPVESLLLAGDFFRISFSGGSSVCGAFVDSFHFLVSGDVSFECGKSMQCCRKNDMLLIGHEECFQPELLESSLEQVIADRRRFLDSLTFPPNADTALWKAASQLKTQCCSAEGQIHHLWSTPDRWPHARMWLWDSVFHAAGMRHINPETARSFLLAVFDLQQPDGFIPHAMDPYKHSSITQPPVLALGAQLIQEKDPSPEFIAGIYPKLVKFLQWIRENRDSDGGGLVEWAIEADANCRSGESGMDNSPRFDDAIQLDAPDFNAFLAHEYEIIAGFAEELGLTDEAESHRKTAAEINRLMNERLWNDAAGFYVDLDVVNQKQSAVLASSGFLPLLSGAPDAEKLERMLTHLAVPGSFGTAFPVPSISRQCEKYYSKDMWRGPVWICMNWLIIRGLKRCNRHAEAEQLRIKTVTELEKYYHRCGTFFEFYDDRGELPPPQLLRKGRCAPEISPYHQAFSDFGWSATLYIDMAMQSF
ncbi:MAG: trehalase family glycosidase [Kiritimatiellales bacterium]